MRVIIHNFRGMEPKIGRLRDRACGQLRGGLLPSGEVNWAHSECPARVQLPPTFTSPSVRSVIRAMIDQSTPVELDVSLFQL